MSWQRPGNDCHKVTAGFRSNALKLIQSGPQRMTLSRGGGGGGVSRYYVVITTVCQLGH